MVCPSPIRIGTRAEPINPDDPVIRIFIRRRESRPSRPTYPPGRIFLTSSADGSTRSPGTYS